MSQLPKLPQRRPDAHKGECGHVLLIAGSRGMAGAAVLAANGAYRAGAGLVTIAVPDDVVPTVAALQVCAIVRGTPSDMLPDADVVAIGPGLGNSPAAGERVRQFVAQSKTPLVLDADGLNAFADQSKLLVLGSASRILTPHPGELARLTKSTPADVNRDRRQAAEAAAREFKSIVVLKGNGTVVTDGTRTSVNETGNAGMAKGGSGDVLTGIIAALLAQGLAPFDAARLGAHLHGRAGDLAAEKLGQYSMMATDLLDFLPQAFLEHGGNPA